VTGTTRDALEGLVLEQPSDGYRVNVDAVLLADFAGASRGVAFDLGAGAGAIGLLLAMRGGLREVVLVERDARYAELARANARHNGIHDCVSVLQADVASVAAGRRGTGSLVVCNPPYVRPGSGRAPKDTRAAARVGDPLPFVRAARDLLGRRGRACFVYPAADFVAFARDLADAGLHPKRARFVHASRETAARIVLIEAKPGKAGGLRVEAPLFER